MMSADTAQAKNLVEQFCNYLLVEKGLSENSIFAYTYDLKKFQSYLDHSHKNLLKVKAEDISSFLKEQTAKSISSRSLARSVAALRHFYRYLQEEEKVAKNPVTTITSPAVKKTLPDYLTLKEIDELFASVDEDDTYELRDKALFELMYSGGLRISEACSLFLEDLDMENSLVSVKGKGGRVRLVPFGEEAASLLQRYLSKARPRILNKRSSDYVFISKKSERLNRKSVWRFLKKYLERTKITKTVTPHTFRHSFAAHLIQNNADVRTVQELLGHIDISTTQIYTHLSKPALKKTHKEFHPRS